MKQYIVLLLTFISLVFILSCSNKSEIQQKDLKIDSLIVEITKLKETPNGYFLYALEKYKEDNFAEAINKLESLKNRFPLNIDDHKAAERLIKEYKEVDPMNWTLFFIFKL